MRTFRFKGFEKDSFYKDGAFTIGKIYAASHVDSPDSDVPSLCVIEDDNGYSMWEETHAFEEVFGNE